MNIEINLCYKLFYRKKNSYMVANLARSSGVVEGRVISKDACICSFVIIAYN
jgi:hypothetical protein